jgi:hypothetical protein
MTDLASLLRASVDQMTKYVILPGEAEKTALALFIAHTYAIDGAHATPYLLVTSPERESGKTRMLENLELQVAVPWRVTGASEAAMFRKIEKDKPTLMLDEVDAIFGTYTERTEGLRSILNAGNRPGAVVTRCDGDKHEVRDYSVYCPKVLAGIDTGKKIPETIRGRSIPIRMQRKTGGEKVAGFRFRFVRDECESLRREFESWALDVADVLLAAVPALPEDLGDRAGEGWEPLLAIADMAGGEWPARAREAAIELSAPNEDSDQTYGGQLLEAIKSAMGDEDRITTAELCVSINEDEGLPFGGWREGKGLDGRTISKLLNPYGIKPRTIDVPGAHKKLKGYLRDQLEEAWERWLPTPPEIAVTAVTAVTESQAGLGNSALESGSNGVTDVTDTPPEDNRHVVAVTDDEEAELQRIAERFGA